MVRSFDSFDFEVEHKPRAKIGLADYLSPNLNGAALPVSAYDRMFTVAKIRSMRSALGLIKTIPQRDRYFLHIKGNYLNCMSYASLRLTIGQ